MRRYRLLLAAALLSLACAGATAGDRLDDRTKELEQVREQIQALSRKLDKDRGQQDQLREVLTQAEQRIASAVARLRELDQNIQAQAGKVAKTRDQRGEAQRGLDQQKGALATQVRAAYLIGQQGRTKLLLNQEDPSALSRMVTYYDYVNKARTRRIQSINSQIQFLRAIEQRLQQEVDELAQLRATQKASLDALEAGYDDVIWLSRAGYVLEGPASNLFLVQNGALITPGEEILPGITRATFIELAEREGVPVRQLNFTPFDLYNADEVFTTSTAGGALAVREIMGRKISQAPGPVTTRLQDAYFRMREAGEYSTDI